MKKIISFDNDFVKMVTSLKEVKYRKKYNKFVIEGFRGVKDILFCSTLSHIVLDVVISEGAYTGLKEFCDNLSNIEVTIVPDLIFEEMSDNVTNQGILALATIPNRELDMTKDCLVLDRLRDPGNMGTLIRTACACGFDNIIAYNCVDIYNPKVVRSTVSAILKTNIIQTENCDMAYLKNNGYMVLTADMTGDNLYDILPTNYKKCLIIGNEANGVGDNFLKQSDKIISLPMQNIESLNASVCGAVMMYTMKYIK